MGHWFLVGVGVVIGVGIAMPGWRGKGVLGSLATVTGAQAVAAIRSNDLKRLFDLSTDASFTYLGLGALAGLALFHIFGSVLILAGAQKQTCYGTEHWVGAAGARVRAFLLGGLPGYDDFKRQDDAERRHREDEREASHFQCALAFQELLAGDLARSIEESRIRSVDDARYACEQMGGMLLRIVFEPSRQENREFRLAIFLVDRDRLRPWVKSVGPPDAPHTGESLGYSTSFLGDVIVSGSPDIWVQGAKTRPFEKRGRRSFYKCFYAQPVPCEAGATRIGFTIDYIHKKPGAFTQPRIFAIRAFARYIQAVYALAQMEVQDEAKAADHA